MKKNLAPSYTGCVLYKATTGDSWTDLLILLGLSCSGSTVYFIFLGFILFFIFVGLALIFLPGLYSFFLK